MTAAAMLLAAGVLAPVSAQQPQAGVCTVALGRGATSPGGAAGTMTVRNVGEPCRISNFTVPESRVATSRLEVVKAPAQGQLDVVQPNLIAYTPRPGFAGRDEFAYGGSGPGRDGRILPFSVRVSVRVLGPDEALR
ncbi:MAG: Ig-like domain-containing protein [Candidatus Rokuibacteriota bacterium]